MAGGKLTVLSDGHKLTVYPIPQHHGWRYAGDCECGWHSSSCSSTLRVWEQHREQTGKVAQFDGELT